MKVALTKSTLLVPPTYFAVNHAQRLQVEHEFKFFTLAARLADPSVTIPVRDFVPLRSAPFRWREMTIPLFLPAMSRAIGAYAPDLIHQHFATWSQPAVAAASRTNTPLITTVHGADIVAHERPAGTAMLRWHHFNIRLAQEQSSRILAVSEYLAARAVDAGFSAAKVHVHYQGIDTEYFSPAPVRSAGEGPPQVLFVGALNEQKGIQDLLQISTRIIGSAEHELVVVGDGPLREEVRSAAADWPHIRLHGAAGRETVRELMRGAFVLVAPSQEHRGAREAAGLVLLEAQACGTPVLGYHSGGTGEMVDPDDGALVPEGEAARLQNSLIELLNLGGADYAAVRRRARDFVVSERSLEKSCTELSAHYDDVAR